MTIPWATFLAVYGVVWSLCLFVVLPFGIKSQHETGEVIEGTDHGAPVLPRLWWKVLWTSLIAAVVTAVLLWGLSNPLLREYWS